MDPSTPEEWQEAVDIAQGALTVHDAKAYGLIRGGPDINVERCAEILRLGEKLGYQPAPNAHEMFVAACNAAKRA
jgi:hypothetical protein